MITLVRLASHCIVVKSFTKASLSQISEELQIKPFDSLSVGQRAHAIAWLCDELVTSKAVTEEIDSNMEDISGLKRDKWELEGKIRE